MFSLFPSFYRFNFVIFLLKLCGFPHFRAIVNNNFSILPTLLPEKATIFIVRYGTNNRERNNQVLAEGPKSPLVLTEYLLNKLSHSIMATV